MATEKESAAKVDLGLLEEDDEFEEFPADGGYHLDEKDPLRFLWTGVVISFKYS